MTDILSQSEVETLLASIDNDLGLNTAPKQNAASSSPAPAPTEKVNPYDFKRPERVGKEQMRALQSLHEGFGRNFGAALSGILRTIVDVKLASVDQMTYSEFVFALENPTCFNLLKADPLESYLILDINPAVLFPIIDRLLGGGKESNLVARRPLTEIELRLVSRITDKFLEELCHAWSNIVKLDLSVERVESNPQLVQVVPPNEVVVLISFELTIGGSRGLMNLCIPFNSIERVGTKLSANSWMGYRGKGATEQTRAQVGESLNHAQVELVVTLATAKISTGDLLELRVGDVITTDKDTHEPLEVAVQGVPKFGASPGALKGRKAIEVSGQIEPKQAEVA